MENMHSSLARRLFLLPILYIYILYICFKGIIRMIFKFTIIPSRESSSLRT